MYLHVLEFSSFFGRFGAVHVDHHESGDVQDRCDAIEFVLLEVDTKEEDEVADLSEVVRHDVLEDVFSELSPP